MSFMPDLAQALELAKGFHQGDSAAPARVPMILGCSEWDAQGIPPIALAVNFSSVSFRQPKRISKKNTQGGTAYFHWTDENGQNNDILELQIKGQTGYIRNRQDPNVLAGAVRNLADAITGGRFSQTRAAGAGSTKHYLWARLWTLTRAPVVGQTSLQRNVFYIKYRSPLFPGPFVFQGFFNNALEFGEEAERPFNVPWSFSFIVQRTNPSIDEITNYLSRVLLSNSAVNRQAVEAAENTARAQNAQTSVTDNPFKSGLCLTIGLAIPLIL